MPQTTVQVTHSTVENTDGDDYETTQYRATIPKQLAEALGLEKGDSVEWSVESANKLSMEKVDD